MLRAATSDDLGAIMAIERSSFPTDAWSEAMMRAELESPHNHYVVAEEAGVVVGYAGVRAPAGASDGDVQTIALDANRRGRGAGRALLHALLEFAAERRVHEMFLDVRADNPIAQGLYVSEGFREIARRPNYYAADGVDGIVMRLDLRAWTDARHPSADDAGVCT